MYMILFSLSRIFGKIARLFSSLALNFIGEDSQNQSILGSAKYDMVSSPDEIFYLNQYWSIIYPKLDKIKNNAKILDLGCGQGRFSAQMAANFPEGFVEGCDISPLAIKAAKKYAHKLKLTNIEFTQRTINDFIAQKKDEYYDIVILTEVTFFYPAWLNDLLDISRVLKPGGILILANRSQYFNALYLAKSRQLSQTDLLLNSRKGRLFGDETTYTWQRSDEIKKIILERLNFNMIELFGIGVCSGIPGDPHDYCRPSLLSSDQREQLSRLELELGAIIPDAGRYILTISQKPTSFI